MYGLRVLSLAAPFTVGLWGPVWLMVAISLFTAVSLALGIRLAYFRGRARISNGR